MCSDALEKRRFSDIVAEFNPEVERPLQIIGGQHRFDAIKQALNEGVETEHGLKVYFQLDKEQRLNVQVISNTNISVSKDLMDRMYETVAGAELRDWCQHCDLLEKGQDFAGKSTRSSPMTVKEARTFIANYYLGHSVPDNEFGQTDTTPNVVGSGEREPPLWRDTKKLNPELWSDKKLLSAGKKFAAIRHQQILAFYDENLGKYKGPSDYRYKAKNLALLAGWAFVAGCLEKNTTRLKRHYDLINKTNKDPFRADLLAGARHSSDLDNYRGLGYRSDAKERGRFAELFWLQAEKGNGISKPMIDAAIQNYEAKQATLRAKALQEKL